MRPSTSTPTPLPNAPQVILIVEDNPVDRLAYRGLLAQCPGRYTLLEAEMGEEGLAMFAAHAPDCVLLDFNLPDLTGIEFLNELQPKGQSLPGPQPVIMLTGEGNQALAVETMKRGAQDYLIKGQVNVEQLHRAIQNTIEKIALHKQVRQQQREHKEFAHVAAHDLRSPLTKISNYSQLLDRRYREQFDERGQKYLDEILSGTRQMATLIEVLLEYGRAGHSTRPFAAIDLRDVIERAQKRLSTSFEEAGASLTWSGEFPQSLGDEVQLIRLFQNLFSNALKFRREIPLTLHVHAEVDENCIQIAVRDNGIGMAPDQLPLIFEPFARLEEAHEVPGHGIGLAICRKIAEQHQGHLMVESKPGEGSTFTLILPRPEQLPKVR